MSLLIFFKVTKPREVYGARGTARRDNANTRRLAIQQYQRPAMAAAIRVTMRTSSRRDNIQTSRRK